MANHWKGMDLTGRRTCILEYEETDGDADTQKRTFNPPLKDRLNQYALFRGTIKDTEATHTIDPM